MDSNESIIPIKNASFNISNSLINDIYHEVYVGYKYQLFMNGIPILEPATITLEKLVESKREVDFVKVERAINLVESKLMPMISESKGIMKLVKS